MRFLRRALVALILTALTATGLHVAAPDQAHAHHENKPAYFVHGVFPSLLDVSLGGLDCQQMWQPMISRLRNDGWKGPAHTVAFDYGAMNCNTEILQGDDTTPINPIAKALAWDIHNRHTRHNRSVTVIAHGMGGLVIRRALAASQNKETGWPRIMVDEVVTLATPHRGTDAAKECAHMSRQCQQMVPGSGFLQNLAANAPHPQGAYGTKWTLISADSDSIVSRTSGWGMGGSKPLKVAYRASVGYRHTDYYTALSGGGSCDRKERDSTTVRATSCEAAGSLAALFVYIKLGGWH